MQRCGIVVKNSEEQIQGQKLQPISNYTTYEQQPKFKAFAECVPRNYHATREAHQFIMTTMSF
ncbi:unnamed protein product [Camellia sinensis]